MAKIVFAMLLLWIQPLAATPQRLITLTPHLTEWVFLLEAGDQLVAVSDYSDYPQAAKQLPSFNTFGSLNVEAILALQPDLVLAWRGGNPEADLQRLQQYGIHIFYSDPQFLDDIAAELLQLGELLGRTDIAKRQARAFRQRYLDLQQHYSRLPKLASFFALGTEPLMTVANRAWPAQVMTVCAADNIFADAKTDYPQVALEQVVARQPAVIIQATRGAQALKPEFWQRFQTVAAVKQQAFITLDADQLYRPTPRILDAAEALCQQLQRYR